MQPGVALARNTDTLAITGAGLDAHLRRLRPLDRAFAVAGGAGRDVLAGAVAAGTGHIELHPAPSLGDLTFPAALRASASGLDKTVSVAMGAGVVPADGQAHHPAADSGPEGNIYLIFEVGAGLGSFRCRPATPAKDAGKDVAESARTACLPASASLEEIGEVEPVEVKVRALGSAATRLIAWEAARKSSGAPARAGIGFSCGRIDIVGIKTDLVVDLALFGIAQDIVGLGDGLEFLFRRFVAGIHVGVILASKLAERLANLLGRGGFLHTEEFVVVLFGRGGHRK